jgi:CheY-like chemotaxis protein
MLQRVTPKMVNGLRVLIFDDDHLVRGVVAQICRRRGYEVVEFEDGNHFCIGWQTGCPCSNVQRCADVIISDIKMPGITGVQLMERLIRRGCGVPHRALMSGYWTPETLAYATEKGFRIFRKPVGIWEIDGWLLECEQEMDAARRELVWLFDEELEPAFEYAK